MVDERFPLPEDGMIPETYQQKIDKLKCTCPGGAIIKPAPLPSATVNIGDVIADQARLLQAFTSVYGMITVVIRMIACIIDVICAINNPFALIPAVIRLFGTCLPDFILLFPQLAIPAIIVCLLKILLAIVEYILEVIVPLLVDIVNNLSLLANLIQERNTDAVNAVAFKLAALIKELFNVVGILSALDVLFTMIEALIKAAMAIPCGGSGGSCPGCGDDQCPDVIKQASIDGNDGVMTYFITGPDPLDFEIRFSSAVHRNDFLTIREFFPAGVDYSEITDRDKIAYILDAYQVTGSPPTNTNERSYVVTSVRSNGTLEIEPLKNEFIADGYFSNLVGGVAFGSALDIRFGTDTETFDSSWVGKYLDIIDESDSNNNGTYEIKQVYDSKNVRLNDGIINWTYPGGSNPARHIEWRESAVVSSSIAGSNYFFSLEINHEELLRHDLIGVGCHPAVSATAAATNAKFPLPTSLPSLPTPPNLENCVAALAPITVNSQYIIDNYDAMAAAAPGVADCLTNTLSSFSDEMVNYINQIYPPTMDKEASLLSAIPTLQIVGGEIDGYFTPIDLQGGLMGLGLPAGTLNAEIAADGGTISATTEVLDEYGAPTGEYMATLTSDIPAVINISASLDGYEVSDFDGYNFLTRYVTVEFVEPSTLRRRIDMTEPLGVGSSAER
jgi:hypothetical protein